MHGTSHLSLILPSLIEKMNLCIKTAFCKILIVCCSFLHVYTPDPLLKRWTKCQMPHSCKDNDPSALGN